MQKKEKGGKMNRRYRAWLIVENFPHREKIYKKVYILLFREDPEGLIDQYKDKFASLIKNYEQLNEFRKSLAELRFLELFTWHEIEEMKPYFENLPKTIFHYEEVKLPIDPDIAPCGNIAVVRDDDFIMFSRDENYRLSFRVRGYYDVEDTEYPVLLVGPLIDVCAARLENKEEELYEGIKPANNPSNEGTRKV